MITYNSTELVPAPFINIQKNFFNKSGFIVSFDYNITLTGKIVITDGSGMNSIQEAQREILDAFDTNNENLVIQAPGSSTSNRMTFKCEVQSINFSDGLWYDFCDYTVVLSANKLEGSDADFDNISDFGESWRISFLENDVFEIAHDVFAVGIDSAGSSDGFAAAKSSVRSKLASFAGREVSFAGYDIVDHGAEADAPIDVSDDENYWNRSIVEQIDPDQNRYAVAERLIYHNLQNSLTGSIEDFSVSVTEEDGALPARRTINIRGSISGLATDDSDYSTKSASVKSDWNNVVKTSLATRAGTYADTYTLNPVAKRISYTIAEKTGVLDYEAEFVATNGTLLANAIEETLSIDDDGAKDVIASIEIPGRIQGPIIQYMGTRTSPRRTISYRAKLSTNNLDNADKLSSSTILNAYLAKPNTDFIFLALAPSSTDSIKYYLETNQEQWDPSTLDYSRTMSWTINMVNENYSYQGMLDPSSFGDR